MPAATILRRPFTGRLATENGESQDAICPQRRYAATRNIVKLRDDVMRYGIYNPRGTRAVPPTGSISYVSCDLQHS